MESLPESYLPGGGVVGMGAVVVDRKTVINIQDTAIVTAESKLPKAVRRNIDITSKHIAEVVSIWSGSD